jgi:acetyltransferase-like isoleucine patch superfamily enzyme
LSFISYLKKILLICFSYLPSAVKLFFYRISGAIIGKNVELGIGSSIIPFGSGFKKIRIGDNVIIGDHVHILSKNLVIGAGGQIKNNTQIWGQSGFTMGKGSYIDEECHFDLRREITLGNEVVISGGCWFYTHMVSRSVLDGALSKFGPIIIDNRTYLGANVFVLPDITIGRDVIVGARAVVTKNVSPDSVIVGNPAREIGKTSQKTKKLSREDKNIIIKNIFKDLFMLNEEKVFLEENSENGCSIKMDNMHIVYLSSIDNISTINAIRRRYGKKLIIVSLEIPEEIKKSCSHQDIFWIDLGTSTRSLKMNKNFRFLEDFFKGYGIKIS